MYLLSRQPYAPVDYQLWRKIERGELGTLEALHRMSEQRPGGAKKDEFHHDRAAAAAALWELDVYKRQGYYGLAAVDVSTGDFRINEWAGEEAAAGLADELLRLQPAECIYSSTAAAELFRPYLEQKSASGTIFDFSAGPEQVRAILSEQWGEAIWEKLTLSRYPAAASAAAAALSYLKMLQHPARGRHFRNLELSSPGGLMLVDGITARNLELTRTIRDGKRQGSLLGLLDHCLTAMGRRLMRLWVEQPLNEQRLIEERLDAVEEPVSYTHLDVYKRQG